MGEGKAVSTPFLSAMLIADLAIREIGTEKVSLIGIFEQITAATFPYRHPSMVVYAKITDAVGHYDFRFEIIHLTGATRVGEVTIGGEATSRTDTGELVITMRNVPFPRAGTYEVRLSANGRFVGSKTLRVDLALGE